MTAALLLNRNTSAPVKVTIDFSACNVSHPHTDAEITDLWTSKSVDHAHSGSWSATISPHAQSLCEDYAEQDLGIVIRYS